MNNQKLLISFLKRNFPDMAVTFDEGIGIASERYFMAILIKRIMKLCKIKSVLESPADGSMGIPGLNSVFFARNEASVCVSSPYKPILSNAKKFWLKLKLGRKVRFVYDPKCNYPFKKESFDLVWNSCLFEHFSEDELLPKMIKVSRRWIFVVGQSKFNWGYPIHLWYHRINKQVWDHGLSNLMNFWRVKKLFKKYDLKIVLSGLIDIPPWLDTFDMHTRGLGKKFVKNDSDWYWSALQEGDVDKLSRNGYIKFLDIFQKLLFFPLNFVFGHHYYILARKK